MIATSRSESRTVSGDTETGYGTTTPTTIICSDDTYSTLTPTFPDFNRDVHVVRSSKMYEEIQGTSAYLMALYKKVIDYKSFKKWLNELKQFTQNQLYPISYKTINHEVPKHQWIPKPWRLNRLIGKRERRIGLKR